ncbi:MAG: alpha/beta fold hydrolase [Steroidobacteraceae bacterium]
MTAIADEPIRPPRRLDVLRELRLPVDALGWVPDLVSARPRRARHPASVVLLPGFGTGPRAMHVLEVHLRGCGHRVRDWGLGLNTGEAQKLRVALEPTVRALVERHGEPVSFVGWSLGGFIAREYAREHPDEVRSVVTLGTPVIGGPRYTATARRYRAQGHDLDEIERAVMKRYETPLEVPVTAVYSKRDGIVAWQACIDRWSPRVRHVEVEETHLGLVFSPRVRAIVANALDRR